MKNKTDEARDAARDWAWHEAVRESKTVRAMHIEDCRMFFDAGVAFAESQGGCEWSEGDEEPYKTSCGQSFEFTDDGIKENSFKFCPFCGGKISEPAGSEDK